MPCSHPLSKHLARSFTLSKAALANSVIKNGFLATLCPEEHERTSQVSTTGRDFVSNSHRAMPRWEIARRSSTKIIVSSYQRTSKDDISPKSPYAAPFNFVPMKTYRTKTSDCGLRRIIQNNGQHKCWTYGTSCTALMTSHGIMIRLKIKDTPECFHLYLYGDLSLGLNLIEVGRASRNHVF